MNPFASRQHNRARLQRFVRFLIPWALVLLGADTVLARPDEPAEKPAAPASPQPAQPPPPVVQLVQGIRKGCKIPPAKYTAAVRDKCFYFTGTKAPDSAACGYATYIGDAAGTQWSCIVL